MNCRVLFLVSLFLVTRVYSRGIGDDAPEDQEPGDVSDNAGQQSEGSGSPSIHTEPGLNEKMRCVTNTKKTGVRESSAIDAEDLMSRLGSRKSNKQSMDCASGYVFKSPIGILHELDNDSEEPTSSGDAERETNNVRRQTADISSENFKPLDTEGYPGFATGLLKSKNCTAFLIGKTSALTLAECVYNVTTGKWTEDLDLWRGRNCSTYINLMKWESVTIPRLYYTNGDDIHNWAYIKYTASTPSANWIGLSLDYNLADKVDVHVTLSGYLNKAETNVVGCPQQCSCLLLGKMNQIFCPSELSFAFPGSPLVAAPEADSHNFVGLSPRLYGIASGFIKPSVGKVTTITEEMFWLVYELMVHYDDKPTCNVRRQEWFINRLMTGY